MRISAKEQNGLRAMVELADRYGEGPVPLGTVAVAQGLSLDYLEQVIPTLREAGLLHSTRGARGGYELARPPARLSRTICSPRRIMFGNPNFQLNNNGRV